MKSAEVRRAFLSYFEERGHTIVPSASLVPAGDPTLLFVNAGMVPFKDVFLGKEKRSYTRAASVQKCLRVSGKHNDLEEVGPSSHHHTFFEMLGNFSFGDYFKEEALGYSWEFLTKVLGLPPEKLRPTVFEEDGESARIWSRLTGRPGSGIVRLGPEDNFWAMGDTGPCGPNSEIIYDRTGKCLVDGSDCPLTHDCDRWWELWNNVFMQYDRAPDGTLTPLARAGVDTGMGFERLCAVLQGAASSYETDLFVPIIERLRALAENDRGLKSAASSEIAPERRAAYRAVADHARAVTFLLADGLVPSNEGRGYVLRRILRRAVYQLILLTRPAEEYLGRTVASVFVPRPGEPVKVPEQPEPIQLSALAAEVINIMASAYPELLAERAHIERTVQNEEESFRGLLVRTGALREAAFMRASKTGVVSAEDVFQLYDTFGVPLELTTDLAKARGLAVDLQGFNRLMGQQRERGREAQGEGKERDEALFSATRDLPATRFLGYETMVADAKVLLVSDTEDGVDVVLDATPFYAEGGGQVGDRGRIVGQNGEIEIAAVRRLGGVFVHSGRITRGTIAEGESVRAEVDEPARRATMRNHTATHLLHKALRLVLGPQAKQAGSLVAPDRLRFDFVHGKPLTDDELSEVERIVREQIVLDRAVRTDVMPTQEALGSGADAMFDEKYGEEARVVSVSNDDVFSRELCGGTHCHATGEIGAFFIVDQRSVGAGVRRVEAVTGFGAFEYADARRRVVDELSHTYNVPPQELPDRLRALQERARDAPKAGAAALPDPSDVLSRAEQRNGSYVVVDWLDDADANALRQFGDALRSRAKSAAIVLGSMTDEKLNVVVMLTRDLVERGVHAGKLAQQIGKELGGGGGGRPDVATAGGTPVSKEAFLAKAKPLVRA